jgi:hypothetical protein
MLNRHHGDYDYRAIIDGGLSQESVEAWSPIHGDQREAQHREYMAYHHSVYTSDVIIEVMVLEAAFTLGLHLMRVFLHKGRNHFCSGREVVNQPRVLLVVNSWHSSNGVDEIRGHMDLHASDPSEK